VTQARAAAADCAILDLSLPDASGLQALVALRALSPDLPIVVLTGFDDLEVGLSALRCGADDYLVKSQVDGFTLDRAVRYAIARRQLVTDQVVAAAAATVTAITAILCRTARSQVQAIASEDPSSQQAGATAAADRAGRHQVARDRG
jgi:DNA-binding NarL/FixJ family response regulator